MNTPRIEELGQLKLAFNSQSDINFYGKTCKITKIETSPSFETSIVKYQFLLNTGDSFTLITTIEDML